MIRIRFTGDIMCNIAQTNACRTANGFCYDRIFEPAEDLLTDCDYLVGNLETPLAGEKLEYSNALYSFNTPDAFAQTLKDVGFHLVSTANNHCMDRDTEGLRRTLDTLDQIGLDHIGTHMPGIHAPFIRDIQGVLIGFVAYTYGTNAFFHHRYLPPDWQDSVNLLQPEELTEGAIDLLASPESIAAATKELYGRKNDVFDRCIAPLHKQIEKDIQACRNAGARYVIFILHCGGQYNAIPDAYTRYMVKRIRAMGVDAIVGHHPHVIHPLIKDNHCPVAYSLGNFTYTPGTVPRGAEIRGTYSAVLTLHISREEGIVDTTYDLTRSVVREDGLSQVIPVRTLLHNACGEERTKIEEDIAFCENVLNSPLE